jgi:glycosyltransferase involved in cell wall biosynthesis
MKVSVALCTYNGEQYLLEQLESIVKQTQAIDELVICDDGSNDRTADILHDFARQSPFKTRVYINNQNIGSTRNFERCLAYCNGDIIFLADQDDIWVPTKVEKLLTYFAQNPNKDAVFSDAKIIDQHSNLTGKTAWQMIEFDTDSQRLWQSKRAFDILLRGYVVTGATLAIRKKILPEIIPIPHIIKELIHDGWIALWLSITNRIGFLAEPLTHYRHHQNQQVGFGDKAQVVTLKHRVARPRAEKLAPIYKKYEDSKHLYEHLRHRSVSEATLDNLQLRQKHYAMRASLPASRLRRVWPVLTNLWGYRQHDGGYWWRTVVGDIFE